MTPQLRVARIGDGHRTLAGCRGKVALAPNGRAVICEGPGDAEVFNHVNLVTGLITVLGENDEGLGDTTPEDPAWAADGTIALKPSFESSLGLYRLRGTVGNPRLSRPLRTIEYPRDEVYVYGGHIDPDFSPDGRWLAFTTTTVDRAYQLKREPEAVESLNERPPPERRSQDNGYIVPRQKLARPNLDRGRQDRQDCAPAYQARLESELVADRRRTRLRQRHARRRRDLRRAGRWKQRPPDHVLTRSRHRAGLAPTTPGGLGSRTVVLGLPEPARCRPQRNARATSPSATKVRRFPA